MRAYNSGLINLNASKNQYFANQGLLNPGDYTTSGNSVDFSKLSVDPNQQFGGYRNELKTEADMLDAADNGPDRGFSGGLSQQAARTAQQAVGARQTSYQQNLQSTLGNYNQAASNDLFNYQEGSSQISSNAKEYAANEALWQATNPTAAPGSYVVPGSSGGGSTPIKPTTFTPTAPQQQGLYTRTGPETASFGAPKLTTARGGMATTVPMARGGRAT